MPGDHESVALHDFVDAREDRLLQASGRRQPGRGGVEDHFRGRVKAVRHVDAAGRNQDRAGAGEGVALDPGHGGLGSEGRELEARQSVLTFGKKRQPARRHCLAAGKELVVGGADESLLVIAAGAVAFDGFPDGGRLGPRLFTGGPAVVWRAAVGAVDRGVGHLGGAVEQPRIVRVQQVLVEPLDDAGAAVDEPESPGHRSFGAALGAPPVRTRQHDLAPPSDVTSKCEIAIGSESCLWYG